MIYAKEPESLARVLLGDKQYDSIANRTGVEGGKGHKYYEDWRNLDPESDLAGDIAKDSRSYYDSIRSK